MLIITNNSPNKPGKPENQNLFTPTFSPADLISNLFDNKKPSELGISERNVAISLLKKETRHLSTDSLEVFQKEILGTRFVKEGKLNKEAIFQQINLDLERQFPVEISGKKAASAEEIYKALGENTEALKFMVFLQQGLSGKILDNILNHFNILGMESQYRISNTGSMINDLKTEKQRLVVAKVSNRFALNFFSHLELKENISSKPIGLIKIDIATRPSENQVISSWRVVKVAQS